MKEVKMTPKQVMEEIKFEDSCGVNDLLQELLSSVHNEAYNKGELVVYMKINNKGENCGWVLKDKNGKDMHL